MKSPKFELLFITEGESSNPAAEIQFGGQRLCIVRPSADAPEEFELEFLTDLYVRPKRVEMIFPSETFIDILELARSDLRDWLRNLANSGVKD